MPNVTAPAPVVPTTTRSSNASGTATPPSTTARSNASLPTSTTAPTMAPHHHSQHTVTMTLALQRLDAIILPPVEQTVLASLGITSAAARSVTAVSYAACALAGASLVEGGNKAGTNSRLVDFANCEGPPSSDGVLVPGWWQLVPTSTPSDTSSVDVLSGMVLNSALLVILATAVVIICAIRQPATEADLTTTAATAGACHSVVLGYLAPSGVAASAALLAVGELEGGVVGVVVNVVVVAATTWACTIRTATEEEVTGRSAHEKALQSVRDRAGAVVALFIDGSRDVKVLHIRMHAFIDLAVAMCIGLLSGLLPRKGFGCVLGAAVSTALLGATLGYVAYFKPHKHPFYQYAALGVGALQLLLGLCALAASVAPAALKAAAGVLVLNDLACIAQAGAVAFVVLTTVHEPKTVRPKNHRKPAVSTTLPDNEVPLLVVPETTARKWEEDVPLLGVDKEQPDPCEIRNPLLLHAATTGVWVAIPARRSW